MVINTQATKQDFEHFVSDINNLIDKLHQKSFFRFKPSDRWQPAMNLYEADDEYVICLDLAGVDAKQVNLHAEPGQLRIIGSRPAPMAQSDRPCSKVHVMEIDDGPFQRVVQIADDVDIDRIKAQYHDGLLWIKLPKRQPTDRRM